MYCVSAKSLQQILSTDLLLGTTLFASVAQLIFAAIVFSGWLPKVTTKLAI